MPRSNKLIDITEQIHPDLHSKLSNYATANDFEVGYALENILQSFFASHKTSTSKVKQPRTSSVSPSKKLIKAVA